ncbi:hypothetical protein MQW34_11225 [Bacillus sp. ZJS3]|nr:hypothetical protein MQW34_11225 [Bacillus sp. ZJS3]
MKIPLKKWCMNKICRFEVASHTIRDGCKCLKRNGSMMNQIGANER